MTVWGLHFGGLTLGQFTSSMANLDDAMTMAYSGELDYMTISEVFCLVLSACELTGNLERMDHWCRAAYKFATEHHCPFLSAYCRTTYGTLLTAIGKWTEAEQALTEAIQLFQQGIKGYVFTPWCVWPICAFFRGDWKKQKYCYLTMKI